MAEIKFDSGQAASRSMLVPVLIALVLLAIACAWFAKIYLHPEVSGRVDRVENFPVHQVFTRPAGTMVGDDETQDATYAIAEVTLEDHSEVPLFIKDITGTLTTADGLEIEASAIEKNDLPRLAAMFPAMKPAVDAAGPAPLVREATVPAGGSGSGYVIFAYNVPKAVWDKRKDATVSFDFYHQDKVTLKVPK